MCSIITIQANLSKFTPLEGFPTNTNNYKTNYDLLGFPLTRKFAETCFIFREKDGGRRHAEIGWEIGPFYF